MGGSGEENAWTKKEGPGDHCIPNVELINTHPPEVGPKAFELVVNARDVACIRYSARQSGSIFLLVVTSTITSPLVIDDGLNFFI